MELQQRVGPIGKRKSLRTIQCPLHCDFPALRPLLDQGVKIGRERRVGSTADQQVGDGSMTLVRLSHEFVPGHECADEDADELSLRIEVRRQRFNIIAEVSREGLSSCPFVVAGLGDPVGGHEVARIWNRQPGAAQDDEVIGFNAPKQPCQQSMVEDRHACLEYIKCQCAVLAYSGSGQLSCRQLYRSIRPGRVTILSSSEHPVAPATTSPQPDRAHITSHAEAKMRTR